MARRSLLFTPGDRPEMLRKAPDSGADAVIFDLEDAISPERKQAARETVASVLAEPSFDPACGVYVRVNGGATGRADLEALPLAALDGLVCPKVGEQADVLEAELPVLALIETAAGVLSAPAIAAHSSVEGLVFGAEDLAADVGARRTSEGTEVLYARQRVVVAAAAADVLAIDTIVADYTDEERLRADADRAVGLGFDGKLAIHPAQVGPINEAFTPDQAAIEWAGKVLAAAAEADRGVFEVDGEMIDAPLIAQAKRIAERARAAGQDV